MNNLYDALRIPKANACANVGIIDKDVLNDGLFHRTDVKDDPHGKGDGSLKIFLDGKGGIAWNHKTGQRELFFVNNQAYQSMTTEERRKEHHRRQLQIQVNEQKRRERHEAAAIKANSIWNAAHSAVLHCYLNAKKIGPHGTRIADWSRRYQDETGHWRRLTVNNCLVLPLFNETGALRNLQAIFPAESPELGRSKDFLPGGEVTGVFWWVGPKSLDTVCIAEGFATAATIFEQTGYRTYIAFSAGNLLPVGQIVRKNLPGAKIIFCADNDDKTAGNPGLTKANEAAGAVNGFVAVPPMSGDFNDYATLLNEVAHG